jgi:hypothetical protein
MHGVFVDSACSRSLFKDEDLLVNVKKLPQPVRIQGVGGGIIAYRTGDYPLVLQDPETGKSYLRIIRGCLLSPKSSTNLLATNELTKSGVSVKFPRDDDEGQRLPCLLSILLTDGRKVKIHLRQHGGLWAAPSRKGCTGFIEISSKDMASITRDRNLCTAGISGQHPPLETALYTRMLTEAELWHLRLNHAHISKIAELSKNCIGMPAIIPDRRQPCHDCQDSNIIRNDAPPPSAAPEKGAWNVDLVDMGENYLSSAGHRYITIFTISA